MKGALDSSDSQASLTKHMALGAEFFCISIFVVASCAEPVAAMTMDAVAEHFIVHNSSRSLTSSPYSGSMSALSAWTKRPRGLPVLGNAM